MIKAHVIADGLSSDHIGVHEFAALPHIGCSISVIDQNSNAHFLTVTDVRLRGLKLETDPSEILRLIGGDVRVTIIGIRNSDWSQEMQS